MNNRIFYILLIMFLLTGCIVKSLHPFYTEDAVYFDDRFLGSWQDNKNTKCEVYSFANMFLKINHKGSINDLSVEQKEEYEKYQNAYYVIIRDGSKEATFSAVAFKIEEQIFLDLTPINIDLDNINELASNHLMGMHTLVKLDFSEDGKSVLLKYFSENKLIDLLNENRVKLRYEKIGHNEANYVLTASSKELQRFLKKYLASDEIDKWETQLQYNFKK